MPIGTCPACGRRRRLSKHHILKFAVFKNDDDDNIIYLCEQCHNNGKNSLEELIRQRENDILRQYPELYTKALRDYLNGVRPRRKKMCVQKTFFTELEKELFKMSSHELRIIGKCVENEIARRAIYDRDWSVRLK